MKALSMLAAFLLLFIGVSQAQRGKVEGKVTDSKTGQPLAGVSVTVKGGQTGISTDVEGRYVLNVNAGTITLTLSFQGASKDVDGIEVAANKVTTQDITFEQKAKNTGDAVTVRATSNARKETAASLIAFQKNTNTVASVISAEAIRRSPDKNTGEVLKRTPGASIQEGKFIVVRGLADRYNQAMLNGILLTSTEPDRKTFSFDLIPSSMVDNIVINKAFVPEYPGEWAGGLIQVNTKDIPAKNFFNIQIGTGFNSKTVGKTFLKDKGGKTDWLGIDDGLRSLPTSYKTKSDFDHLTPAEKTAIGKQMPNSWSAVDGNAPINASLQLNGGFNTNVFGKKTGGTLGIVYNKTNRHLELLNRQNSLANNIFSISSTFDDDRYVQEISWGAMGSLSMQIDNYNKISVKSLVNINSTNYVTNRQGTDFGRDDDLKGSEFTFKQNTFFTGQVNGEHRLAKNLQLKWYGAFNILDGYIPDQRRILYSKSHSSNDPYRLIISNTLSQQSGSRIFQSLSDYIYTAGGDLTYNYTLGGKKQAVKGGYMLQVKDRLYDAKLFAIYLPVDNDALRQLPADQVFAVTNFGDGSGNKFGFDAIKGNNFRYLANTILNAGYLQMDNQLTDELRVVWGLRVEDYDQLVGSVKAYDPRHTHSEVLDFLPGLNATYKLNNKVNFRLSGSQTVIRPEFRELSFLNIYDFELNASVQGNPSLKRTKVTNLDLRYELYPRAGEVVTFGVFYKKFDNPIEQIFNEGSGGSSTFSYQNPESATSYGAEFEFRKKLDFINGFKNFTFQTNASYIYSQVKDARFQIDRPLQGQSPYVVNAGIMYDLEKAGVSATLLFNRVGERIYLVGDLTSGAGSPDIFEAPRSLLDLQVAKKMLKNKAEIRLNISDMLGQKQYFYQNAGGKKSFQEGTDAYRFTRLYGTTFGVTFNYSL